MQSSVVEYFNFFQQNSLEACKICTLCVFENFKDVSQSCNNLTRLNLSVSCGG